MGCGGLVNLYLPLFNFNILLHGILAVDEIVYQILNTV